MKKCSCCKLEKPKDQFIKKSSTKDGLYVYCKDCNKIKKSEAYVRNRDIEIAKKRLKYSINILDPEFIQTKRLKSRLWKSLNKGKVNTNTAKRRAAKRNAVIVNWGNDAEFNSFVIQEAYILSQLRTEETGIPYEVDHIVPLINNKVCGLHVWNNLQVIPASINRSKSNNFIA